MLWNEVKEVIGRGEVALWQAQNFTFTARRGWIELEVGGFNGVEITGRATVPIGEAVEVIVAKATIDVSAPSSWFDQAIADIDQAVWQVVKQKLAAADGAPVVFVEW